MKYVLGAVAAVMLLAGFAVSQPASARCWWNGYDWHCYYPHRHGAWWWRHHRFHHGFYHRYSYHRPYYRQYSYTYYRY